MIPSAKAEALLWLPVLWTVVLKAVKFTLGTVTVKLLRISTTISWLTLLLLLTTSLQVMYMLLRFSNLLLVVSQKSSLSRMQLLFSRTRLSKLPLNLSFVKLLLVLIMLRLLLTSILKSPPTSPTDGLKIMLRLLVLLVMFILRIRISEPILTTSLSKR